MAAAMDMEVHEKYLSMPREEFIQYFNSQNFSWTITDYKRTFHFGVVDSNISREDLECQPECDQETFHDLPKNFDSREKWPHCETIKEIYDQSDCGSCWTFGSGNTASDRTCIHKGINIHLSEQDFQCLQENVCEGGEPLDAFQFWKDKGLVSNKCKPYDIPKLKEDKCKLECVNKSISYKKDKHFAERVYNVCGNKVCNGSPDPIKLELEKNGPIQAGFKVYEDFIDYRGGIYEHTYGSQVGLHSVRVIGYGEEKGKEYWLVANSWGKGWGDKGFVKVKTYQEALQFEGTMCTGIPKN